MGPLLWAVFTQRQPGGQTTVSLLQPRKPWPLTPKPVRNRGPALKKVSEANSCMCHLERMHNQAVKVVP